MRPRVFALIVFVVPILVIAYAHTSRLEGLVLTTDGLPLPAASVRVQGQARCTRTDATGRFQLPAGSGRITATRTGYRIGWISSRQLPLRIELAPLPNNDNDDYAWIAPGPDATKSNNCANCHQEIHREWAGSAHARSATNPKLLALLSGTDGKLPPRRDWNLQAQHPDGAAVCVNCHAPTFQDPTLEYDLRSLGEVAASGVHCDYCHKIAAAPTDKLGIRFGRDGYPLLRPRDGDLFSFGPLDDAVRPGESFAHAPFYKESRYCASCHEGIIFGVHVYGTYSEWLASPARQDGKQCQSCHMAPTGTLTNMAPGKGGIERDQRTLASHSLAGAVPEMLRTCLKLQVEVNPEKEQTRVATLLRADNVGHRVPTGFIDRHLVLVVETWDAKGNRIAPSGGPKLDAAAGPDLAGLAGWLYAKRLHAAERSPVPFWVPPETMTDTRLYPHESDRRTFTFPAAVSVVRTRLFYRRFWSETAEPFQWRDNEIVVHSIDKPAKTETSGSRLPSRW
jgi:hypothetical protein